MTYKVVAIFGPSVSLIGSRNSPFPIQERVIPRHKSPYERTGNYRTSRPPVHQPAEKAMQTAMALESNPLHVIVLGYVYIRPQEQLRTNADVTATCVVPA